VNAPPAAFAGRRGGVPVSDPIRLMIVDDSPIARAVLSRMLSSRKEFEVAALASGADEALDALRSIAVDIVLLDVEMPGTNGLEALPEILRRGHGARVLIVSSLCEHGGESTVRALALGAADTLPKPGTGQFGGSFSDVLAERLRRIGKADRGGGAGDAAGGPEESLVLRPMPEAPLGCLALGASTGGLHALSELLRELPRTLGAPILVTQHLPPVFMPFFARQIEAASGRRTRIAEDGITVLAEEILLAPGDAHLALCRNGSAVQTRLCREPARSGCMPSVDPMLASVGEVYGASGLGIVMSGMGRDGVEGSRRLVDSGGAVLAQDRQSSAVWGMPRAVAEAGLASAVLPPGALADRVAARLRSGAWR
jgi:two-component system chemotaxis response regulator CheB